MLDGDIQRLHSDIVLIPATQGKFFMVDAEDEARVRTFKWCANWINHGWYGVTWDRGKHTLLHRFIVNAPRGMVVDHINGDTLNCCKWNLRVCTRQQNNFNRIGNRGSASGFKGVSKCGTRWKAQICLDGKRNVLGSFDIEEEAARAYDAAAVKLHGSFASLNFPEDWVIPERGLAALRKAKKEERR